MIRPNNPAIDFETLRARVRARAERLRSSGQRSPEVENAAQALLPYYRAADGYLDRAEDLNFPITRIPARLAALRRITPALPRLLLLAYNYALRKTRQASTAQANALREVTRAGAATARRLSQLEGEIARLRVELEGRRRNDL